MAYLLDTDVLIDFLRGRPEAAAFLADLPAAPFISVITVAELYVGVREGAERTTLEQFIGAAQVLPLSAAAVVAGRLFRRQFGPSHHAGLTDCLIAATATSHGLKLVTLNRKYFPMLPGVVPYQKG